MYVFKHGFSDGNHPKVSTQFMCVSNMIVSMHFECKRKKF